MEETVDFSLADKAPQRRIGITWKHGYQCLRVSMPMQVGGGGVNLVRTLSQAGQDLRRYRLQAVGIHLHELTTCYALACVSFPQKLRDPCTPTDWALPENRTERIRGLHRGVSA